MATTLPWEPPPARQLSLFGDDSPQPVATTPQPARTLSEFDVVGIKGYLLAGRSVETVANMFGIDEWRVLEANDTKTALDDVGPSEAELDRLFGPRSRPPGWPRDERDVYEVLKPIPSLLARGET